MKTFKFREVVGLVVFMLFSALAIANGYDDENIISLSALAAIAYVSAIVVLFRQVFFADARNIVVLDGIVVVGLSLLGTTALAGALE